MCTQRAPGDDGAGRSAGRTRVRLIVPAHHGERVSTLRLWQACAVEPIDLDGSVTATTSTPHGRWSPASC
jgi:hypothetical protein